MASSLPRLTFVTGNKNKIREVSAILDGIAIIDAEKMDLPEMQGDAFEIAKNKALLAFATLKRPCMIEDTSLCFHALGDLPGPYIKWFMDSIGCVGLDKMLAGFEDKTAHALCIFTIANGPTIDDVHCYAGRCEGSIVAPRGPTGFGWDPVFQPAGFDTTFAEMDGEIKNGISHRRKALDALKETFAARVDDGAGATKRHRAEHE